MPHSTTTGAEGAFSGDRTSGLSKTAPAYQAYQILHVGFVLAPIVAGIDKFFHLLTNWDQYLAPLSLTCRPSAGIISCSRLV